MKDNVMIEKAFLKMRNSKEIGSLLSDILSIKEFQRLEQKLEIATMLSERKSYEEIIRLTGASSATIAKVNEALKYGKGGLKLATERLLK